MKYQEIHHDGSFTAQGTGFLYEYHARLKALGISRAGSIQHLLQLDLDGPLSADPFELVRLLEKTTQIKALKFSNNATTDLAETLDDPRLPAILHSAFRVSAYAFSLGHEQFDAFQDQFTADHELKRIEIQKVDGYAGTPFYLINFETKRGNFVSVRSSTLHGATSYLSDKIMQDIIAKEFSYNVDAWVHKLLGTASALSTLSFVMNPRFVPAKKTRGRIPSLLAQFAAIEKSYSESTS